MVLGQTNQQQVNDGPTSIETVASTSTRFDVNQTTYAISGNSIRIGPNPDGQSVMSVAGLLMSDLTVSDPNFMQMWAGGSLAAPGNNPASGSVTATLNTTPAGSTGTAHLKIDLLWMIYESNPNGAFTQTGFDVAILDGQGNIVLRARTPGILENGVVEVTDASGTYQVPVFPGGGGLTPTRTLTNVPDGAQFTIRVDPYTENDGIFPGQSGEVDVSLAIDARVQVVQ
jgi:hypothetical protein